MDRIDWSEIPSGVLHSKETSHKGWDCVRITVKGYEDLPWFVHSSIVAPAIDIVSTGKNFASYFKRFQPVKISNELAIFKEILACLKFLKSKRMALSAVASSSFCHVSEEQPCVLSPPHCDVVKDYSGEQLARNMKQISRLKFFKNRRMVCALRQSRSITGLSKHPAMWGPIEDASLLLQFFSLAGKTCLDDLDTLIRCEGENGKKTWIRHEEIIKDIERGKLIGVEYNGASFHDLIRYIRNKIAHFGESHKSFISLC